MRTKVTLSCSDCSNRNYYTTKNKKLHSGRVEYKKYCPTCNNRTLHKESK